MSKFIKIDKNFYNANGVVPIKRGDDVSLSGKILESDCGSESPVDMTGAAATAYFSSVTGQNTAILSFTSAERGEFEIAMDKADTPNLETTDEGIGESFYIIVEKSGKLETIETKDSPLEVLDRGYFTN